MLNYSLYVDYIIYYDENSTLHVDVVKITKIASSLYDVTVLLKIIIINNNVK